MKINLNSKIKAKLTDYGKTYLANRHVKVHGRYADQVKFTLPEEDEAGYSEWQLWEFIGHFGDSMLYPDLKCVVKDCEIEVVDN